MESTRSAASSRLVSSTGHSGVPAYSASMASRTASIRAPFSGRKYRASRAERLGHVAGHPGQGVEAVDGVGHLGPRAPGAAVRVGRHVAAGQHVGAAGAVDGGHVEPAGLEGLGHPGGPAEQVEAGTGPRGRGQGGQGGHQAALRPQVLDHPARSPEPVTNGRSAGPTTAGRGHGRGSGRGSGASPGRRTTPRRPAPGRPPRRAAASMCSTSASGGSLPCCFHTTIGTPHTSQSATQQVSSSWCHSVIRAASHSSHAAGGPAHPVYTSTVEPTGTDVPAAGDGRDHGGATRAGRTDRRPARPRAARAAAAPTADWPTSDGTVTGLGSEGDLDGHRGPEGLDRPTAGRGADDLAGRDGRRVDLRLRRARTRPRSAPPRPRRRCWPGPVTAGTATGAWPFEVTMVTVEPYGARPAGGCRRRHRPPPSSCTAPPTAGRRPTRWTAGQGLARRRGSWRRRSGRGWPPAAGRWRRTTSTVDPCLTVTGRPPARAGGCWLMTTPAGTVIDVRPARHPDVEVGGPGRCAWPRAGVWPTRTRHGARGREDLGLDGPGDAGGRAARPPRTHSGHHERPPPAAAFGASGVGPASR